VLILVSSISSYSPEFLTLFSPLWLVLSRFPRAFGLTLMLIKIRCVAIQRLRALDMHHLRRFIELNTEVFRLGRLVLRRLEGLPPVMQEITRTEKWRAHQRACHARSPNHVQSHFITRPFHTRLIQPFERGRPRRGPGPMEIECREGWRRRGCRVDHSRSHNGLGPWFSAKKCGHLIH